MDSTCIWILIYGRKAENNACTRFAPNTKWNSMFSIFVHTPKKEQSGNFASLKCSEHTARWLFGVAESRAQWWNVCTKYGWHTLSIWCHKWMILWGYSYMLSCCRCRWVRYRWIGRCIESENIIEKNQQKAHVESTTSRIYSLECSVRTKRREKKWNSSPYFTAFSLFSTSNGNLWLVCTDNKFVCALYAILTHTLSTHTVYASNIHGGYEIKNETVFALSLIINRCSFYFWNLLFKSSVLLAHT